MTITKLFLYIGLFAAAFLVPALIRGKVKNVPVALIQFFVGALFIFSGVVKAIDPVGTAIKMEEYFEVFTEYLPGLSGLWHFFAGQALAISVLMIVLEIFLGITLLLGKYRRITLLSLLGIILFFTFLTGFSHYTGKVTDCGCFGDFLKLTPFQSYKKDILLMVMILILIAGRRKLVEFFREGAGNRTMGVLTVITIWFTMSNYYDLPVVDFRAYKEGVNIPECLELPPNAKPYIYETTFIYRNKATGEEKAFVNSWPEDFSAWDYVDRKDRLLQKGDDPKCKDFTISDADGNDVTAEMMEEELLFVITSHDLHRAHQAGFDRLRQMAEQADQQGISVIGITGSSLEDAEAFRHELGLAVDFYNTDAVPIKTMNRSNPGLVVLGSGTVLGKWHHSKVRSFDKISQRVQVKKAE